MEETLSILNQSKNEYSAMLTTKITSYIIEGIYSIFNEAVSLCEENNEELKYLMTFQQFLSRITRWNKEIIEKETKRIIENSNCPYLEDLLTCVHIAQTKILTSVRVGTKQKKLDTHIPSLPDFIHKVYIETARNIYKNVYLFERNINSLQKQKYRRELELLVQYSILCVIRDSLPVQEIISAYLDDSIEYDNEEVIEETIEEPIMKDIEEINVLKEQQLKQAVNEIIQNRDDNNSSSSQHNEIDNKEKDLTSVLTERNKVFDSLKDKTTQLTKDIHYQQPQQQVGELQTEQYRDITSGITNEPKNISFVDNDKIREYDTKDRAFEINNTPDIQKSAPKDISTLEKISFENNERRKQDEYDEDDDLIQISNDDIDLDLGIETL